MPVKVTPGELAAGAPLSVMAAALVVGTWISAVVFAGIVTSMVSRLFVNVQAETMGPCMESKQPAAEVKPPPTCGLIKILLKPGCNKSKPSIPR